jgi:hypothetical protein
MDLILGIDVGSDFLAERVDLGLRSPVADPLFLAALTELEHRGCRVI